MIDHPTSSPVAAGERVTNEQLEGLLFNARIGKAPLYVAALVELQERRASSPLAGLVENLRFERNFLQKLCAQRAYALDEIGEAAVASEYLPDLVSKIGKILETASSTASTPPAGRDELQRELDEVKYSATALAGYYELAKVDATYLRGVLQELSPRLIGDGEQDLKEIVDAALSKHPVDAPAGRDGIIEEWQPMESAPKNATWIVGRYKQPFGNYHYLTIHWADGGGEDQPRFRGWFKWTGGTDGFVQVQEPQDWSRIRALKEQP